MKKHIKLRDLTPEQLFNYTGRICTRFTPCDSCLFGKVKCFIRDSGSWVLNKDMYSDKFLDQEVEIETPTFTDKEKEYLHNLLKPFKDRMIEIKLVELKHTTAYLKIIVESVTHLDVTEMVALPNFYIGTMYTGLELGKSYRDDELKELLKELDL